MSRAVPCPTRPECSLLPLRLGCLSRGKGLFAPCRSGGGDRDRNGQKHQEGRSNSAEGNHAPSNGTFRVSWGALERARVCKPEAV